MHLYVGKSMSLLIAKREKGRSCDFIMHEKLEGSSADGQVDGFDQRDVHDFMHRKYEESKSSPLPINEKWGREKVKARALFQESMRNGTEQPKKSVILLSILLSSSLPSFYTPTNPFSF